MILAISTENLIYINIYTLENFLFAKNLYNYIFLKKIYNSVIRAIRTEFKFGFWFGSVEF